MTKQFLEIVVLASCLSSVCAAEFAIVKDIEAQPLTAQVKRLIEATDYVGVPFEAKDKKKLEAAIEKGDVEQMQHVLDPYCLFAVHINPEMRVKVAAGRARHELVEQGWRQFLVKVENQAGTTAAQNTGGAAGQYFRAVKP